MRRNRVKLRGRRPNQGAASMGIRRHSRAARPMRRKTLQHARRQVIAQAGGRDCGRACVELGAGTNDLRPDAPRVWRETVSENQLDGIDPLGCLRRITRLQGVLQQPPVRQELPQLFVADRASGCGIEILSHDL